MKVVYLAWAFVLLNLVTSAPTIIENVNPGAQDMEYNNQRLEYVRGRRSHHLAVSPCAAAAGNAPVAYQIPTHGYPAYINSYGYLPNYSQVNPGRVYRADLFEDPEMMAYSDTERMDQVPMARYSHGTVSGAPLLPSIPNEAQAGVAYGVFPNTNVGGCSIPLLVSCSPNVVQGKVIKSEPHPYSSGGAAQSNLYRMGDHHEGSHNGLLVDHVADGSREGSHDAGKELTQ